MNFYHKLSVLAITLAISSNVAAHFQMITPSDDMVMQTEPRSVDLQLQFWHPFEGIGMPMEKPVRYGVVVAGVTQDLLPTLKAVKIKDRQGHPFAAFQSKYTFKRPGNHLFFVEPKPYWEPAEERFIVHYTKVMVNAFGMEEGWDKELGLKTEIVPLTRPYGLWTNNVFQGVVKLNGKPVPNSEVEVEYYNQDGVIKAPADPMITQVVKTDANGVFTYAMPKAGWWAFAALNEDSKKMKHDGKEYPVEIGALLWVRTHDMK
jgi:cobalt/nickel transport protein